MSRLWEEALGSDIPGLTDAGIEAFFSCSSISNASSQTHLASMDSSSIISSRDSVAGRRRHAIYFHRPPVWRSSTDPTSGLAASDGCMCRLSSQEICNLCESRLSYDTIGRQSGSFSSTIDKEHRLCQEVEAANADLLASFDSSTSESDQGIPLLGDWKNYEPGRWSDLLLSEMEARPSWLRNPKARLPNIPPLQISHRQVKPGLCTRLKSYRDIRLGLDERWAIQEGSLVICIDPLYTLIDQETPRPDEFQIVNGDVYIICRLYADLWALCVKASFKSLPENYGDSATAATPSLTFGFIPLCAVTLAANFSAFVGRSDRCSDYPSSEPRYPGNGLPVLPPMRSHSLIDSKQVFQSDKPQFPLPIVALTTLKSSALEDDTDFIPLDSTLEQILSKLMDHKGRSGGMKSRVTFPHVWSNIRSSTIWKSSHKGKWHSWPRSTGANLRAFKGGYRPVGKATRSSSPSERLKFLLGL
ncbi:hypothetical protein P170DRAFT_469987 [Aspergillus steynii IBT 23096]|uniref:Uncharacterized protein n=1 Tax=Aspergillus steynii IBT 23096 TaxID=1392250 RepID=A0A2I2GNT5_9EURO|nr:uncharacterized protein P170DRAFT_469987 [Aspergillus steynii IBT 23096]PLB54526.1 hypothetical protein P170DRAFT_469987 [Aspergillus steynii IBT 23096]